MLLTYCSTQQNPIKMTNIKQHTKSIFLLLVTAVIVQSCNIETTYETVNVKNRFSVVLPSFLTKTNDLNDDASLQYQNERREFYIAVIEESFEEVDTAIEYYEKEENIGYKNTLEDYKKMTLDDYKTQLTNAEMFNTKDTVVNNMQAITTHLRGTINGVDIFYSIGIFKGKTRYYQANSWTLASNENLYKDDLDKIIYSIKEVEETE